MFHLHMVEGWQSIELIQPVCWWDGPATVLENNTFNHLGETGTELKQISLRKAVNQNPQL
jgi:hypothetical protein